jgi:hypothetical protein
MKNCANRSPMLVFVSLIVLAGAAAAQKKVQPDNQARMELDSLTVTNAPLLANQKASGMLEHLTDAATAKVLAAAPQSKWSTIKKRAAHVGLVGARMAETTAMPLLAGPMAPALQIASQVQASRIAAQMPLPNQNDQPLVPGANSQAMTPNQNIQLPVQAQKLQPPSAADISKK